MVKGRSAVITGDATTVLSRFISDFTWADLPTATAEKVENLVIDGVAAGLFGSQLAWSRTAVAGIEALGSSGPASVWGHGSSTAADHAAMLNGSFVQGYELDDYHEFGPIHSLSIVLPTVVSLIEARGIEVSGQDLLAAVAVGIEVGTQVGTTIGGYDLISRGWHCGAVYGTLASAAAASRLLGLDAELTEDALGMAATQSSGLMSAQFEADVKRMHHGFSARAGITAAVLAAEGYRGIRGVLQREYGGFGSVFAPGRDVGWDVMADRLGSHWEIDRVATKAYACNAGIHPSIDGVRDWLADGTLTRENLAHLLVTVPDAPYQHAGWEPSRPLNAIGAQMNLNYTLAATMLTGSAGISAFLPDLLGDDEVWSLSDRIEVQWTEEWQRETDAAGTPRASRLVLTLADGTVHERIVPAARGTSSRPMSAEEIDQKALEVLSHVTDGPDEARTIVATVRALKGERRIDDFLAVLRADRRHHGGNPAFR